jgi:hypothetical protein
VFALSCRWVSQQILLVFCSCIGKCERIPVLQVNPSKARICLTPTPLSIRFLMPFRASCPLCIVIMSI